MDHPTPQTRDGTCPSTEPAGIVESPASLPHAIPTGMRQDAADATRGELRPPGEGRTTGGEANDRSAAGRPAWPGWVLAAVGAVLMAIGAWRGDPTMILGKAVTICLQCIGIG